jgi:uncharacterized protein YndB with AHSA1/START domain
MGALGNAPRDARRPGGGAIQPELTVSRLIDAPPALVFKMWTEQEHAARWWGPQGFTAVSCRLEGRAGGTFRIAMRAPDGTVYTKRGLFHEVVPPKILVFTYAWEDANGNPGHEMRVSLRFEAEGQKTLLTLHQTGFESVTERDSHQDGWTSCLERFAGYTVSVRQGG